MATTVVDTRETGTEIALYDHALFPTLLDQDPIEVRKRFEARFMRAETIDDLFDVLTGNTTQGLTGQTVTVNTVSWAPYESDDGLIPLAVCEAVNTKTGEIIEFATTGQFCTLFLRRAELIKALPVTVRIVEKLTRSGQKALNFERP